MELRIYKSEFDQLKFRVVHGRLSGAWIADIALFIFLKWLCPSNQPNRSRANISTVLD